MQRLDFYQRGPDRPWANPLLVSAAIVGHTTDTTTRLWVRAWAPATYCLIVSDAPIPRDGEPILSNAGPALLVDGQERPLRGQHYVADIGFATDLTAVFDVHSLSPGGLYYYALFATAKDAEQRNNWELPPDEKLRRFRTRPANQNRIAFGLYSCHMPYTGSGNVANTQMWEQFAQELEDYTADFAIGGGDQVYTDGNDRVSIWRWLKKVKREMPTDDAECVAIMRSWYRDIYRGYWGIPQVRRLFERFPNYMIWDDHEIKDGWGSYKKKELANELDTIFEWENSEANLRLAYLMFEAAKLTYHEYEHSHNPQTAPGVFDYSFGWSGYPFFILDMRGHRDFNRKTQDRILGAAQMQRFMTWLTSSEVQQAPAIFIVSPVPVVHVANFIVNYLDIPMLGVADDLRDEWEHKEHWHERNRILDAVFALSQKTGQPVVFLSGDVHVAAAFRLFRPTSPDARVFQLTSSGITYASISGLLKLAVREHGQLGDSKDRKDNPTSYRLLHRVLAQNNFGIVEAEGRNLHWHIYGNSGQADTISRLKAVRLE